ncbi:MAG: tetratricopeptide repeat protein [Gemmatimonadaceae bacterium]|nr:tetratricopeptide repeat protein [Gemmatimonadaceae bacterium]
MLALNADLHPASENAHDSLAEAYEAVGDATAALRAYRRVLELNPAAGHAAARVAALTSVKAP